MPILVLAGLALAGWFLVKAGAISILLIVALIPYVFLVDDKRKEEPWAKALSGFIKPALIALSMLTVLSFFYTILAPDRGERLINWEEFLTIHAYRILKQISPTWWLYLILLALASWVDANRADWNAAARLSTGKKYLGLTISVVTLLASVTFFGQAAVIRPAYWPIRDRLTIQYLDAKEAKDRAVRRYVAERVVTQAFQTMTPYEQNNLERCFFELSQQMPSELYKDHLNKFYASRELGSHTLDLPAAPDGIVLSRPQAYDADDPDPEWLASVIPSEEAASKKAIALEASSKTGLDMMAKVFLDTGSDQTIALTVSYLHRLVDAYAEHFGITMPGVLDDLVAPVTKSYVSQYVDKVVDLASSKIKWRGIPTGTAEVVAATIASDKVQLAAYYLAEADRRSKEILVEVQNTQSANRLSRLEREADNLNEEARQAGGILKESSDNVSLAAMSAEQARAAAAALATQEATQEAALAASKEASEACAKKELEAAAERSAVHSFEESLTHLHE